MNIIDGKIEIMTKISSIPNVKFNEISKIKSFKIKQGDFNIVVNLPEKMFKRIEDGAKNFEFWVCAINGKIKSIIGNEIEIIEPAVQIFESKKKPKPEEQAHNLQKNHHKPQQHQNQTQNNQNNKKHAKPELEIKNIQ